VEVARLDLADQASVTEFAEGFLARDEELHLLVNNAGLGFVNQSRTVDGHETTFGVNHLGHMALTLRLLPALTRTTRSRVVTVSSSGHRLGRIWLPDPDFTLGGWGRVRAYTQSKLANVLFALELDRRLRAAGHGTMSLVVDPGGGRTELGTKQTDRRVRMVARIARLMPSPSAAQGARPSLRAATDPEARSGEMYAPRRRVFGPPVLADPASRARDERLARQLWEASLHMLSMPEPDRLLPLCDRAD
jgi:NAD(P)-dependent dehydrogenase (short-subunit alcohol dehydrogenase family)